MKDSGENIAGFGVLFFFFSFFFISTLLQLGPGCRIIKVVHRRVGCWVSKAPKFWMKNCKGYFRESENSGVIVEKFGTVIP